jgi:RNA-directed DNA polymerase
MVGVLTRYADDFVIQCRNESCAREALRRVQAFFGKLKLKLHPEKTRVVNVRRQGIDFLGCHLRKSSSWRTGRWYLYRWPGRKAMRRIRERIRALTDPRKQRGRTLAEVVASLRPILRGWGNAFRSGNATKQFSKIDAYVFERLRIYAHRQRPRENDPRWRRWYAWAWYEPLGVYRLNGTIRYPGVANAG